MYINEYYDLSYDSAKNQINWKVKGFWNSAKVVPNMEKDWDATLAQAEKPGFNILADLTMMVTPPEDVVSLHMKVQTKLINAGAKKVAAVSKSVVTWMAVKDISKVSGMKQKMKEFNDLVSAQAWLDEK
jgi:hypothetical protein